MRRPIIPKETRRPTKPTGTRKSITPKGHLTLGQFSEKVGLRPETIRGLFHDGVLTGEFVETTGPATYRVFIKDHPDNFKAAEEARAKSRARQQGGLDRLLGRRGQ